MQQTDPSAFQVKRFLRYLREFKFPFFVAVIGMVGYSAVDTFVFAQLQPMIDESLGKNDQAYLRLAAYAIVPLFLLRGLFNFLGTYTLTWIGSQVVMRMRQQLFDKYIHLPVSFHDTQAVGALISKVTYDTEQVANASGKALLTLVREGALVIGLLAVMFYYSWQLSLIFLLIGPLVAVIVSFVSKRFRVVSRNIQQAMGNLTSAVEQAVKGHKVVIMFGGQTIEQKRFEQKNNNNRQQTMKLAVTQILSVSSIQVIASVALAVVLYIASTPGMVEKLSAGVFINVVFYYGSELWQAAGFDESQSLFINVLAGTTNIVSTFIAIALVDKIGRKPLLLVGSIGMFISLSALTYIFGSAGLDEAGKLALSDNMGTFALIMANLFVVFFGLSWGPIVWVLLGEMFNNRIRGAALAVAASAQWIANFAITMTFPIMLANIGLAGAYGFYALSALISIFFVVKYIKETRGKTLESM